MAAEGGTVTFIYRGGGRDTVPRNATHVIMHESVTVVSAKAFCEHPNIVEVYCHAGVKKVEREAFSECPRLKRVVMPGVETVEDGAFGSSEALEHVECGKLEYVDFAAFGGCNSLISLNLPSAKDVIAAAFVGCEKIAEVKFGETLDSIGQKAFCCCHSLEAITIPLKNSVVSRDDVFDKCNKLRRVYLVEGDALNNTIAALQLEEWRKDMREEVDSINFILPWTSPGHYDEETNFNDVGEKSRVIRYWVAKVLRKVVDYKARHRQIMREAATTIMGILPNDIVMNSVLPFLDLPSHTFDGEENEVWWSGWNGEDGNSYLTHNVLEGLAREEDYDIIYREDVRNYCEV